MASSMYPEGSGGVHTKYSSGVLQFLDSSGNVIMSLDPANRQVDVPSGSTLANAGTSAYTGTQTFDDILGGDSSLAITGAAGSSGVGGALAIAGGAGDGASNNGGAITITSGASGGASGTAGAITIDTGSATGGTEGGITIGSAATKKVGFFGATPVVQASHIADTAGDDATAVNAILVVLENLGFVATS